MAPRLTFRRIVDGGDRVEELGDYELVDVLPQFEEVSSRPRGCDSDSEYGECRNDNEPGGTA